MEAPRVRRCDRPGCAAAATSLLSFDGGTGQVRITRIGGNPPPLTLVLCTTHTDRLVVPRGWVLHDERDEGHLFAAPGEEAPQEPAPAPTGEDVSAGGPEGPTAVPARSAPKPRAAGRRRAPRKAAADPPGDPGVPAGSAPGAPGHDEPPLFATPEADTPKADTPEPAAQALAVDDLTRAPEERRLLHRAFRAASTREVPEPDPHDP